MPSSITLTPRLIYKEDLAITSNPAGATASVNVLGAGSNPQTLNLLALVLLTQFTQASNDTAAAAAGVAVGSVYYNTTISNLATRLT